MPLSIAKSVGIEKKVPHYSRVDIKIFDINDPTQKVVAKRRLLEKSLGASYISQFLGFFCPQGMKFLKSGRRGVVTLFFRFAWQNVN